MTFLSPPGPYPHPPYPILDTYWLVMLGPMDNSGFNGYSESWYPSRESAIRFARGNCEGRGAKVLDPDLVVRRRYDRYGRRVRSVDPARDGQRGRHG